jgi:hypothetical protein
MAFRTAAAWTPVLVSKASFPMVGVFAGISVSVAL